ncbi:hypothetical protein [Ideonella sp.]|uniref:hypothetical protein n=1 Tax=Ideonella sp. TaxID=1929293 RepID=UPI0035B00B37
MQARAAATPGQLAEWAVALGTRLEGLHLDLDAEWRDEIMPTWRFADALAPAQVRRLMPRLWAQRLGGLPPLERLAEPLPRLCLLPRTEVLSRLCTLAIARRPGVLRCCIDRDARAHLRAALAASFEPLMVVSRLGKPVDSTVANWSPVVWACIGWADWCAALPPADGLARELVRLSLPRRMLDGLAGSVGVPAERQVPQAIEMLAEAGVVWPC